MKPPFLTSSACWKSTSWQTGFCRSINGYLGDRGLMLRQGTVVDATIIHAPSSTKNKEGKRDPEMHHTITRFPLVRLLLPWPWPWPSA